MECIDEVDQGTMLGVDLVDPDAEGCRPLHECVHRFLFP
jgi:hypothetical protein